MFPARVRTKERTRDSCQRGKDVLAILPTGFGKSFIFIVFLLANIEMARRLTQRAGRSSVLVVSPLKSIIVDQISEVSSFNCSAMELSKETIVEISKSPPQFIYCSAESIIEKEFLDQNDDAALHQSVVLIVVDESHTVETWTGKRGRSSKDNKAFREAYGKLAVLRSMCKEGTPVLALSGTADQETQSTICSTLALKDPTRLFVTPNRPNLRFNVNKVKKTQMLCQLDWIVDMVKREGINTPKTIIFCDTMYSIAHVMNFLMMKLGRLAFHPTMSKKREDCLVGIFHSVTQAKYKERIFNSLKDNGSKKIVIATSALSMGVNFPNIRFIVMYGPPRDMLDLHQKAGRAGRDGLQSDILLYYYGQQVSHIEGDVRDFLGTNGCFRVAAYNIFDGKVIPVLPADDCCNFCASLCKCIQVTGLCGKLTSLYEVVPEDTSSSQNLCRSVSEDDKNILMDALKEQQNNLSCYNALTALGFTHGFSEQVIADVVENCQKIFSVKDILTFSPVFSKNQALKILGIISEVFDDVDEVSLSSEFTDTNLEELMDLDVTH